MLGSLILCLTGMRIMMFQLSGYYCIKDLHYYRPRLEMNTAACSGLYRTTISLGGRSHGETSVATNGSTKSSTQLGQGISRKLATSELR